MGAAARKPEPAAELLVNRADLGAALKLLKDTVRPGTVSILETVLIEPLSPFEIALTATNTERQMCVRIAANAAEAFEACCISHDRLSVAVDGLYGPDVRIVAEGGHVLLHAKNGGRRKLQVLPPEQFPKMGADGLDTVYEIDAMVLDVALGFAMPAMHTDLKTAPQLCGLSVGIREGALCFVGLDGNRLHRHLVTSFTRDDIPDAIWPDKFCSSARGVLSGHEGPVIVESSRSLVRLVAGNITLLSKLIEGVFGDHMRVVAAARGAAASPLSVHSAELARALTSVARMSETRAERGPVVDLRVSKDGCEVRCSGMNEGEEPIDGTDYAAEDLRIRFLAGGLITAARAFGEVPLSVGLGGPHSPIVLTTEKAPHRLAIVMPQLS